MPAITVANFSFEDPSLDDGDFVDGVVTDWVLVGSGGIYDPDDGGGMMAVDEVQNETGENVAFLDQVNSSISQTLAGYTYSSTEEVTFTVDVGDPTFDGAQDFIIEIIAFDGVTETVLGSTTGNTGDNDTMETFSVTSGVTNPALNGQDVIIRVTKTGQGGAELFVDNARAEFVILSNGIVDGTANDDTIGIGFVDVDGDIVDGADGDDDTIEAGAGDDTVEGGAGADSIDGGSGTDELSYANSASGVNVSLTTGVGSGGDAQGDTIAGFENLTGSENDDNLTGDVGANVISGLGGNDVIDGGAGDDTLDGGTGDDAINGGLGDDEITADLGDDLVIGFAGNDSITGGDGIDTLSGNSGDDTISGGDGDDVIQGDGQPPFIVDTREGFEDPTNVVEGADSFAASYPAGTSPLENFSGTAGFFRDENSAFQFPTAIPAEQGDFYLGLHSDGSFAQETVVLTLNNEINVGDVRSVTFSAYQMNFDPSINIPVNTFQQPGSISIFGFQTGTGVAPGNLNTSNSTTIEADPRVDLLGTTGIIDNTTSFEDFIITFTAVNDYDQILIVPNDEGTGEGAFIGIDNIQFGETLTDPGTDNGAGLNLFGDDVLDGGAGNDTIDGNEGNDSIDGGSGNDVIDGGIGNDTIDGGADADTIQGGAGSDSLSGGGGNDEISGDPGAFIGAVNLQNGTLTDTGSGTSGTNAGGNLFINDVPLGGSVTYAGIATTPEGEVVDLIVSFDDYVDSDGNSITPPASLSLNFTPAGSIQVTGVGDGSQAQLSFEFVDQSTNLPIEVSGFLTAQDIDGLEEGVGFANADFTQTSTTPTTDLVSTNDGGGFVTFTAIDSTNSATDDTDHFVTGDFLEVSDLTIRLNATAGPRNYFFNDQSISFIEFDDTLDGGADDDQLTGGAGDDVFIETAGEGADTITDFNVGNSGPIDDGDQTNNDFVDLEPFFNETTLADVNAERVANGLPEFKNQLEMLRADAADGRVDGTIDGVDFVATGDIGDVDLTLLDGGGGAVTGQNLTFDNTNVVCFSRGTLIQTADGELPIEELGEGDLVYTEDHGLQPIRWIGSTILDAIDLEVNLRLKPILIREGALGAGYPYEDLLISPQHRVLVRSSIAQRMFDEDEVLIPANKLLTIDGIDIQHDNPEGVEYFHLLFDEHEIVCSNGAWTESLFTGPEALMAVSPEARTEIETLFPEICEPDFEPISARYIPEKGKLMKKLAQRHHMNKKPLYML